MAMAYNPYGGYQPYYPAPPQPQQMQDQFGLFRGQQYQPQSSMGQQPGFQTGQPATFAIQPTATTTTMSQPTMIWVNGPKEAVDYPMAPNSAVALWDSTQPVVYRKTADPSGKPELETYDLVRREPKETPRNTPQPAQIPFDKFVTRDEFNNLYGRFEALMAQLTTPKPVPAETVQAKEVKTNE